MRFIGPNNDEIPAKCKLGNGESIGLWFVRDKGT